MINKTLLKKLFNNKVLICNCNLIYGLIIILKHVKNKFLLVNDINLLDKIKILYKHNLLKREIENYEMLKNCIYIDEYKPKIVEEISKFINVYNKIMLFINTTRYNLKKIEKEFYRFNFKIIRITHNYCVMFLTNCY